jgi:FkbM family methyltransferase
MKRGLASRVLGRIVRRAGDLLARKTGTASQALRCHVDELYRHTHNINNFDMSVNGELRLLQSLPPPLVGPGVIMDVGANVGDWSVAAARALPQASVHCFEPSATTAKLLLDNVAASGLADRIVVNQVGLADRPGSRTFYEYDDPTIASTVNWHNERLACTVSISVSTGEEYCREREVERIAFLKVDVEGGEFAVLKGFEPLLQAGRIALLQFEYGTFSLQQRILVRDFYELLGPIYSLGVIEPSRIMFTPYTHTLEGPGFVNYLAVHRDMVPLLQNP